MRQAKWRGVFLKKSCQVPGLVTGKHFVSSFCLNSTNQPGYGEMLALFSSHHHQTDLTFVYFWGNNVFSVLTHPSIQSITLPWCFSISCLWFRSLIYLEWQSWSSLFGRTRKISSYSEVPVLSTKYWMQWLILIQVCLFCG